MTPSNHISGTRPIGYESADAVIVRIPHAATPEDHADYDVSSPLDGSLARSVAKRTLCSSTPTSTRPHPRRRRPTDRPRPLRSGGYSRVGQQSVAIAQDARDPSHHARKRMPGAVRVGGALAQPSSRSACTLALGLRRLAAGGMQHGDVVRAGWWLRAAPKRTSAMLTAEPATQSHQPRTRLSGSGCRHWADTWAGFRLDGESGRLGTVRAVGFDPSTGEPAWLQIRTGRFVRRTTAIPFADIESIDPIQGRVTVRTARTSR